ncbi:MAG: DUF975 family protein [Lachnospiraceae bacterium]|nr:DUF975 family protein [Lachnospiraceae bacterium]
MRSWSFREVKRDGWRSVQRNLLFAVAVCLIVELCSGKGTGTHLEVKPEDLQNLDALVQSLWTKAFAAKILKHAGIGLALKIVLGNVLHVGEALFFLKNRREEGVGLEPLLFGFRNGNYLPIVKTCLVKTIHVFLYSLLLIVPGIIKHLEHAMVPYILAENPQMDTKEVLERSDELMKGEKWNLFLFHLSFLGWMLLCLPTYGIGELLLNPYRAASEAEIFEILKAKHAGEEYLEEN